MNKQQLQDSIRVLNSEIEHTKELISKFEKDEEWLTPTRRMSDVNKNLIGKLYMIKSQYEFELLEVVQ